MFNPAQVHLALNHFPIVLAVISALFLALGIFKNCETSKRAGLALLLLAALSGIPAFLTGEPAEDVVEKIQGISKDLIHDHEEAGEFGLISLFVSGAVALLGSFLVYKNHPKAKMALVACLIAAAFSSVVLARTAHLGGLIHHEELRTN